MMPITINNYVISRSNCQPEINCVSPENKHGVIIKKCFNFVPWFLQVQFGRQVFFASAHQTSDCHYRRVYHTQQFVAG